MENDKQITKKLSNLSDAESKELLKSLINNALSGDNNKEIISLKDKLQLLQNCKTSLMNKSNFNVGDIVKWKPNFRNRELPEYDEPLIILEILETPILDKEEGPSSTYFNEPLDMIVGMIAEEGEFITFYYDSRRFEHFNQK